MWIALQVLLIILTISPVLLVFLALQALNIGIWISLCSKSLDDHVPASGEGTEGLSFKTSKFGPPPDPPSFFLE